jgi:hypothetical protein
MAEPETVAQPRLIYFHGDGDLDTARQAARPEANNGKRALTRNATVHREGDVEPCDSIVILPSVRDWDAAKIIATYERVGRPIERLTKPPKADEPAVAAPAAVSVMPPASSQSSSALRRLSNKQLRDLASGRGVDLSAAHDRASIIAAIESAAAQKGATP